jgi:hypothetical protein
VFDDGAGLPGGRSAPLAGVRVEVLDGPKAGTFVVTGSAGTYRLTPLGEGPITLRATKDGFDADTQVFYREFLAGPIFRMGAPPHTLWGDVVLAGSMPPAPVQYVQVEILDGPNAGTTAIADEGGRYRFDNLIASPRFSIRVSKARHRTRIYGQMSELRHNQQRDLQIEAE